MNDLDELVFVLGEGVDRAGGSVGRESQGLGVSGPIPDILPLKAQGNGTAIGEQMAQKPLCSWNWNNQPIVVRKGIWIDCVQIL